MTSFVHFICLVLLLSCGRFFSVVLSFNQCKNELVCEHQFSEDYLHDVYYSGLRRLTKNAFTKDCKRKIEFEFMKHFRALSEETPFPFEDVLFRTQCNATVYPPLMPTTRAAVDMSLLLDGSSSVNAMIKNNEAVNKKHHIEQTAASGERKRDPSNLSILYIVLVHNHPQFAMRIIDALDENQHSFIVHVDASANDVNDQLKQMTSNRSNIFILDDSKRVAVTWGGFSIVNATLMCLQQAVDIAVSFDYVIDISGTSYPIKSNAYIRSKLASNTNTFYMDVLSEPHRPEAHMFHQFVECEGSLHRVARLTIVKGINMHIGSQWFAIPRSFALWLLTDALPLSYISYAKYVIIADENYFTTMFKNSPFCTNPINRNLLFVLFDKWENERDTVLRNNKKCLGVDPDHCGRSPTTLTLKYKYLIEASRSFFARKFDPTHEDSIAMVDFIDSMRERMSHHEDEKNKFVSAMIRLKDRNREPQFCLEFAPHNRNLIGLMPCNAETPNQWFHIGRCTPGYDIHVLADSTVSLTPTIISDDCSSSAQSNYKTNRYTTSSLDGEVFCSLMVGDINMDICMDISGENIQNQTPLIGYPCTGRWNQIFQFPKTTSQIMAVQPSFIGEARGKGATDVHVCLEALPTNHLIATSCHFNVSGTLEDHQQQFEFLADIETTVGDNHNNSTK